MVDVEFIRLSLLGTCGQWADVCGGGGDMGSGGILRQNAESAVVVPHRIGFLLPLFYNVDNVRYHTGIGDGDVSAPAVGGDFYAPEVDMGPARYTAGKRGVRRDTYRNVIVRGDLFAADEFQFFRKFALYPLDSAAALPQYGAGVFLIGRNKFCRKSSPSAPVDAAVGRAVAGGGVQFVEKTSRTAG